MAEGYQEVLISTQDLESLKKYQKKCGVNIISPAPLLSPRKSVSDNLSEITKLREDYEELKRNFVHLKSTIETSNVTLNAPKPNPRDRGKQPRLVYTNCYNCGCDLGRPSENKTICSTCYGPGCDWPIVNFSTNGRKILYS